MGKYTKLALTANIVVFSLVFLLHLSRILLNFDLKFANWFVPVWLNYIALVVVGLLIYLNYKGL